VDQKPQLIFTLGREDDLFRIAVVKDRNSKATDPTAKRFITIRWHGDTASFSEFDADWHRYQTGESACYEVWFERDGVTVQEWQVSVAPVGQ
jgi:hypothetical protein